MASDRKSRVIAGMARAGSYYRENLDKFVKEYLGFDFLKWFQLALIVMMDRASTFLWIAARGMGKSYLIAIYICCRCILYPGTKAVIVSGTRGQAINVLTKIQLELIPRSNNLKNEIDLNKTKFDGQYAMVVFKNGSTAKVVTASDNARSNRANLLIRNNCLVVQRCTTVTGQNRWTLNNSRLERGYFMSKRLTTSEFRERLHRVYGDRFELLSEYVNNETKVQLRCNKCGNVIQKKY